MQSISALEIVITFRERFIEAIRTTGEVVPFCSVQPGYTIRSAGDAGEVVIIRETFGAIQVIVEIIKQGGDCHSVVLKTTDVQTALPKEDLRANLLQGETELESNKTIGGRVVLEGLKPSEYSIQVLQKDQVVGNIKMHLKRI